MNVLVDNMHSSMQNTLELSISALKSIYVALNQCPAHLWGIVLNINYPSHQASEY